MRRSCRAVLIALAALLVGVGSVPGETLTTDSRSPYVHRITLYDHDGKVIDPTAELAVPYSPHQTCGKCHDITQIQHGWHFNAFRDDVANGRPGEPWVRVEGDQQQLISSRRWEGTVTPGDAGISRWQFALEVGRHLPGGVPMPDEPESESDRWELSGPMEIDCMRCHAADHRSDAVTWARQIEKQNFKWAPTAAYGLAAVFGEAAKAEAKADDEFDLSQFDPAASGDSQSKAGAQLPMKYDLSRFDAEGRVFFDITRQIPNRNCYQCHTRRVVEPAEPTWHEDGDVHLLAGMSCVDCHRNGLDHKIVRGYEGEPRPEGETVAQTLTCAGCHDAGRLGSPVPLHKGLPPIHFEKLTCTACHSGPMPGEHAKMFQTSFNHALGVPSKDRKATDLPHIAGPIFKADSGGRIAPHLVVWGGDGPAMAEGKAAMYAWPIAHDVRPAAQSLGARGCFACHGTDGPVYFGSTAPADVDAWSHTVALSMYELRGEDRDLIDAWAMGFEGRPAFKAAAFTFTGLLGYTLWLYGMLGLRSMLAAVSGAVRAPRRFTPRRSVQRLGNLAWGIMWLGLIAQAGTSVYAIIVGGGIGNLHGWLLLAHMTASPLFVGGLTFGVMFKAERHLSGGSMRRVVANTAFWVMAISGFAVIATMLLGMTPWLAAQTQWSLYAAHRIAALVLTVAAIVHAFSPRDKATPAPESP
jgi:hypothetical protein